MKEKSVIYSKNGGFSELDVVKCSDLVRLNTWINVVQKDQAAIKEQINIIDIERKAGKDINIEHYKKLMGAAQKQNYLFGVINRRIKGLASTKEILLCREFVEVSQEILSEDIYESIYERARLNLESGGGDSEIKTVSMEEIFPEDEKYNKSN